MDGGPGAVGPVLARTTRLASPGSGIMAIRPRVNALGHQDRFPQTRMSAGCGFSLRDLRRDARQRARRAVADPSGGLPPVIKWRFPCKVRNLPEWGLYGATPPG